MFFRFIFYLVEEVRNHTKHCYFSRDMENSNNVDQKSLRQGMVTVQENKGQKKQMNRYNLL